MRIVRRQFQRLTQLRDSFGIAFLPVIKQRQGVISVPVIRPQEMVVIGDGDKLETEFSISGDQLRRCELAIGTGGVRV